MSDYKKRNGGDYPRAVSDADKQLARIDRDRNRYRCAYEENGVRCPAHGSITESTLGPEKGEEDRRVWLCTTHYRLRADPLGSREALADMTRHQAKQEDWRERLLEEQGLGELQSAWRDMDEDQKRALVARTIAKARTFVQASVTRPSVPLGHGRAVEVGEERSRQLDALYRAMSPAERLAWDVRHR